MSIEQIFKNHKLSKTELLIITTLQKSPNYWLEQGIKKLANHCHSSPSTIIRLAKKLEFSGFTELAYFIKFKLDKPVRNNLIIQRKDWFECYPEKGDELFKRYLKKGSVAIHGNGFSQLVAQYIYNRFLMIGIESKLSIWSDFEMIHRVSNIDISMVIIISKSGSSSWSLEWAKTVHHKKIPLVCFTGDKNSPVGKLSDIVFVVQDNNKFDSEMSYPNLFFGCCLIAIETLINSYLGEEPTHLGDSFSVLHGNTPILKEY